MDTPSKLPSQSPSGHFSRKRREEFFYDDISEVIYWPRHKRNQEEHKEVVKKMHVFSLAYSFNRVKFPETFKDNQKKLSVYITELKNEGNSYNKSNQHNKFNNILNIFLGDALKNLEKEKKGRILKNIFGEYVDVIWKSECNIDISNITLDEIKGFKWNVWEILHSENYKDADSMDNFLDTYWLSYKRGIEEYYLKIRDKCFTEEDKQNPYKVAETMEMFNLAYNLSKFKFNNIQRSSGERYFEHLLAVVDLYLDNEKNPTFNWVMIALLHDIIEDSDIDCDTLSYLFGEQIAHWVQSLSKKSVQIYLKKDTEKDDFEKWKEEWILNEDYQISDSFQNKKYLGELDNEELSIYKKYKRIHKKYRNLRNIEYFDSFLEWWLRDDLWPEDTTNVRVKIYDRIHNVTTFSWFWIDNIDKIFSKIDETITYFLPITQRHHPDLHEILVRELKKIMEFLQLEIQKNFWEEQIWNLPRLSTIEKDLKEYKLTSERVNDTLSSS